MLVCVRLRPLSDKEKSSGQKECCEVIGEKVVSIRKERAREGHCLKSAYYTLFH
jgi:hypothetical protein